MKEQNKIQIIAEELKEKIFYKGNKYNIFEYGRIFSGKQNPYSDTFIKTSRIKIYCIRCINMDITESLSETPEDDKMFFKEDKVKQSLGEFSLHDYDENINEILEKSFLKIILNIIPQEYSLYLSSSQKEIYDESGEIINTNNRYKEEMMDGEMIFECFPEDFNKIYHVFYKELKQEKGFILQKNKLYYLRVFYEEYKTENSCRDFLNNSYISLEFLPDNEGIILYTNKINHLELLQEYIKLKEINRDLSRNVTRQYCRI
ncbi:MAG: hypothetical protein HY934_06010 [Candidatus Firestonebacteria bacterium]|nr:hypothetical protein [Candidatus Firestonebacteria bacterium]